MFYITYIKCGINHPHVYDDTKTDIWVDQWNRRGSPERDPYMYKQLIFNKVAKAIQQQKSSTNDVEQ